MTLREMLHTEVNMLSWNDRYFVEHQWLSHLSLCENEEHMLFIPCLSTHTNTVITLNCDINVLH